MFTWTRAQHFVPEPLYCVPHQSQLSVTSWSLSRFCLCLPCINCYHWDRSNFVAKILRAHTKNDPTMMWRMEWSTLVYITTLQPLLCSTCGHCCCVPASEGTRCHHWCRVLSTPHTLPCPLQSAAETLQYSPPPLNAATFGNMYTFSLSTITHLLNFI